MCRLSVIVCVYNTEEYAERCIKSILSQSFADLELIIVNDGSEGNIGRIAEKYAALDSRVRYLENKKNEGLFLARLRGIRCAAGEYIGFVDSDDYLSFDYYRTLMESAREADADIAVGRTVREDGKEQYLYNLHESSLRFGILEGEELRQRFFGQELDCYGWHTVWNKIWHRDLFEKGMPFWEKLRAHIVMGEDIAFSVVLFWFARRGISVLKDPYYYCVHSGAATDGKGLSPERFLSSAADLKMVFDFSEDFLRGQKAGADVLAHFGRARQHYGRMWRHLLDEQHYKEASRRECLELLEGLDESRMAAQPGRDFYFESIKTGYTGGLSYLKQQIAEGCEPVISFDIFDTLLLRPFYSPKDLLCQLDPAFAAAGGGTARFSSLRGAAEEYAREQAVSESGGRREDVTLDEICRALTQRFHVPQKLARAMCEKEEALETAVSFPRRSGKDLFRLAMETGKRVILISDMYLPEPTVRAMLKAAGYEGYEKIFLSGECGALKGSGKLFTRALCDLHLRPQQVLHIGDSWKSDIEGSRKAGIRALFLPSPEEVFEDRIKGCATGRCGSLGAGMAGVFSRPGPGSADPGTRVMLAMTAADYFDDPYRSFCEGTDLNADPHLIGSYPLGMHLVGAASWIGKEMASRPGKRAVFLGRDGYLMREVCLVLKKEGLFDAETAYIRASRRHLLPAMMRTGADFFDPPCGYAGHTPMSLLGLYAFAMEETDPSRLRRMLAADGFSPDRKFAGRDELEKTAAWFLEKLYRPGLHREAVEKLRKEYACITDRDVLFDVGYSGRIPETLCFLTGKKPDVLYIHENSAEAAFRRSAGGFETDCYYRQAPVCSGLLREFVLAEPEEGEEHPGLWAAENFAVQAVREGAKEAAGRFARLMKTLPAPELLFPPSQEASMPWEGFLAAGSQKDWSVFNVTTEDDYVYSGRKQIPVTSLAREAGELYASVPAAGVPGKREDAQALPAPGRSRALRALHLLLTDRRMFFQKLRHLRGGAKQY